MKIRFYLALAAAALVMTNCSQDEELVQVKQNAKGFTATIEGASRSAVTDAGVFSWTAGDKISVWNGETFDVYANSEGTESSFIAEDEENAGTPTGYAIYPASDDHEFSDGTILVNLPDTYTHGSTNAPMLATITEGSSTLAFKHLGGLMRFVVKNVPVGASSFVFTTTNNILTGGFGVNNGRIQQPPAVVPVTDENNNVTITFDALEEEAESMVFFVPLPVGTYGGYKVEIKGTNVDLSDESTNVSNIIARRTLLLMPTFTCTASGLDKGEVSSNNVIDLEEGSTEATIIGDAEVLVTPGDDADATATLNYTPAADGSSALSISDGSTDGTESGESEGNVIVSTEDASTVASCDINTPSLTVELSAADNGTATYGKVNALTAKQTLIIGEGVTVSNLVVKGGNVIVHGTLSAISRTDDNADEVTYVIYEEEDQIPETTLGENIVAVSAAEYDLIVAFSNGGTVTLDADVTLHKSLILSDDVTLNLDLNNKTLTGTFREACIKSSGNLTISNGNITTEGCAVSFPDFSRRFFVSLAE